MDFESRRQKILDKMEKNSIAVLYSGIEHHVSADEYDLLLRRLTEISFT